MSESFFTFCWKPFLPTQYAMWIGITRLQDLFWSFFLQKSGFIIGSYTSTLRTSLLMSQELMNKIKLWNPFFEERVLGWFSLFIYISGSQLQNIHPKTLKKIRESFNTYSHGILSWEKWFSKISEKRLRLITRQSTNPS